MEIKVIEYERDESGKRDGKANERRGGELKRERERENDTSLKHEMWQKIRY